MAIIDNHKPEHTPGPWKLAERTNVRFDNAQLIRPVDDHNYDHGAVVAVPLGSANARLIVEAPTLYASLKEMLEFWQDRETDTYCEACCSHAPKHFGGPRDGEPSGPIPHRDTCPVKNGRDAIARIEGRK